MIKEIALGLRNRCHFQDAGTVDEWAGTAEDTFISLWDYDEYVKEYTKKNNSISAYDGMLYMPEEFLLDIDGANTEAARQSTIGLLIILKDLDVPYNIYFSGTGFHVGIPGQAFRWKPDKSLHIKVKAVLKSFGIYEYADPSVTDKTRIIRLLNTRNSKSKLWKVRIQEKLLHDTADKIREYASKPHTWVVEEGFECEPVFDVLSKKVATTGKHATNSLGRVPDPVNYPCIQKMMEGTTFGNRHAYALRVASHLRWRWDEDTVRMIMEHWRQKVDTEDKPFYKEEMDKMVHDCYKGNYRFNCKDEWKDKLCKNTCRLYSTKKTELVMTADDMNKVMEDFYKADIKPIDLNTLYGQSFPIYPGEVVIIQAPPKSMKTMLLQNWVNHWKKPTYFMEMEMSPRQIWSRFVMIEKGWEQKEIKEHYKEMRNGITKDFEWLTVDYGTCYPRELGKRIEQLPIKPEIVVVDHMGLMKTKHKDLNMKMEEASQGLMELAVHHNIIVFAISEITKQAFHEGMNLASSRGSFRIAYNANKLLSLSPTKTADGKVSQLHIKSEANRECESLNVNVWVKGVNITEVEVPAYERETQQISN